MSMYSNSMPLFRNLRQFLKILSIIFMRPPVARKIIISVLGANTSDDRMLVGKES